MTGKWDQSDYLCKPLNKQRKSKMRKSSPHKIGDFDHTQQVVLNSAESLNKHTTKK